MAATLVQLAGAALVVRGLAMAWEPLGWIAAGLGLIAMVVAFPEPVRPGSGNAMPQPELSDEDEHQAALAAAHASPEEAE